MIKDMDSVVRERWFLEMSSQLSLGILICEMGISAFPA
jgi:hypothetical protein